MADETKTDKKTADGNMKHDEGYKNVFADKDTFIHFLNKYLKASWAETINKDDLERVETSYIERDYTEKDSDVVYKLNTNERKVYFYTLLELQSSPDFTMPFRLLRYMVNILTKEFENAEKTRNLKDFKLPAIVPIILYNGEDKWNVVRSFCEYTANSDIFGNNIINFEYLLFDLNRQYEDDILDTRKLLDFIFAMDTMHSSRSMADFKTELEKLMASPHQLTDDNIKTFVSWVKYALLKDNVDDDFEQKAVEALRKGDAEFMTYAFDRLVQRERVSAEKKGKAEGEKKGKAEGKYEQALEIARNAIKMGLDTDMIIKLTGLPYEEVEKLRG